MNSKQKALLTALSKLYPEPKTELNFNGPYQLLISVMLSAQCTDKKVNDTTPTLFKRYPDFKALSRAQVDRVASIIKPINYYKTKSRHLVSTAKMVLTEFDNQLPKTHAELTRLPGVGRKTANVVLGELGIIHTLPVDTHVFRVSKRLGLSGSNSRDELEQDICKAFPSSTWRTLHHSLILHGRRLCGARNPKCDICPLLTLCVEGPKLIKKLELVRV